MDLILHIGGPKTGTSAIQYFCNRNRSALNKSGFFYPPHTTDSNGVSGGHSKLIKSLFDDDSKSARKKLKILIEKTKKKKCILLLSSESLYHLAEEAREKFDGVDVRIVAWVRNPLSLVISAYNQSVKRHYQTKTFYDYFLNCCTGDVAYINGSFFQQWADHFGDGNCLFYPFLEHRDAQIDKYNIEQDFIEKIGVRSKNFSDFVFSEKKINGSYSLEALQLKRLFNYFLLMVDRSINVAIDSALQNISDQKDVDQRRLLDIVGSRNYTNFLQAHEEGVAELIRRFHSLDGLWEGVPIRQTGQIADGGYGEIIAELQVECPTELGIIQNAVKALVVSGSALNYSEMRLAEVFGIPFKEQSAYKNTLPEGALKKILAKHSGKPDIYRELACYFEGVGDIHSARSLIDQAHALRPSGPAIKTIQTRIHSYGHK